VVAISRLRLWDPGPFMFGMGLFVKLQLAPVGSPDPQPRETAAGNPDPVGLTCTTYTATAPEVTVALAGVAVTPKSFTVAVPLMLGKVVPGKLSAALLPSENDPDGTDVAAVTVTVTFAAKFKVVVVPLVVVVEVGTVPKLHTIVPLLELAQVPGLAAAEAAPELAPSVSVKTTPDTGSVVL
jgi:hypothetical protein